MLEIVKYTDKEEEVGDKLRRIRYVRNMYKVCN